MKYTDNIYMELRNNQEQIDEKKSSERIVTLDFLRGLSILVMTFAHCFYHVYDYDWVVEDPTKLFEYPIIFVGLGLFVAFVGTWNTFFLLISITANTLVMFKKAAKGMDEKKLLYKQLLSGFLLYIFGSAIYSFGYYGYFGQSIRGRNTWDTTYEIWSKFFQIHTLQTIAFSIMITAVVNYFLIRNEGYKKIKRNLIIYATLAVSILFATQFVQYWVDSMDWIIPTTFPSYMEIVQTPYWPNIHVQASNASFKAWFMAIIAGDVEPLFPCLSTAFVGAMIGIVVSEKKPSRKLPIIGFIGGLVSMGIGGLLIVLGLPYSIFNQRTALSTHLIQLGGQVITLVVILRLVEYRAKAYIFAKRRFVRYCRKWGMIALSIYGLEILDLLPKWTLNLVLGEKTGINFLLGTLGYGKMTYALLVATYSIIWYDIVIRLWSRVNFKLSFEWVSIRLQGLITKSPSTRLDVDLILNKTKWQEFKEEKSEIKLPIPT